MAARPAKASNGDGRRPRLGLALAGGGPEGAIYEIGALRALDESLEGLDLNQLDIYVGISAGAFLNACLANGLDSAQLCRAIVSNEPGDHPFRPETFLTPALGDWAKSTFRVPGLLWEAAKDFASDPVDNSILGSLTRLARALPVGLFANEPIRSYLETIYTKPGRSDDFRELDAELYVIAADLDSGGTVVFGSPGFDHVPISTAVQASTALPGLYAPVEIDGRSYVDGVLLKTLHASVALDKGAELLLAINPIVPVDTARAVQAGVMRRGRLIDRGLPTVLSQTLRTLIHSRMTTGLASYQNRYQGQDLLLIEPRRDDYEMFFTNIFSFEDRVTVAEHAYRETRRVLSERREELGPRLERHGIRLRTELLDEPRDLWAHVGLTPGVRLAQGKDLTRRGVEETEPADEHGVADVTDRLDRALARLEAALEASATGA